MSAGAGDGTGGQPGGDAVGQRRSYQWERRPGRACWAFSRWYLSPGKHPATRVETKEVMLFLEPPMDGRQARNCLVRAGCKLQAL